MPAYHQFCPVAKAMELLDERWTLLVVRELVTGSQHFNALRRGLPRISPSLLSKRLQQLTRAGVIERSDDGRYVLTAAGEELRPIVVGLGHWGARWIGSRLKRDQLDAGFLMWDIRRFAQIDRFPRDRRVVIHFQFRDAPRGEKQWWLVVENRTTDLCRDDPGHEVTVVVESTVRALTEVWTGDTEPDKEIAAGNLNVVGAGRRGQQLWRWLGTSLFAPTRAAARAVAT